MNRKSNSWESTAIYLVVYNKKRCCLLCFNNICFVCFCPLDITFLVCKRNEIRVFEQYFNVQFLGRGDVDPRFQFSGVG